MEVSRLEELRDAFIPSLIDNINILDGEVKNITIENFDENYQELIFFINEGDDEIEPITEKEFQSDLLGMINSLVTVLSENFDIEIRLDSFNDLKRLYELLVINRNITIANILYHPIKDMKVSQEVSLDDAVETFFRTLAQFELKDIFEDYYLDECKYLHDQIFFNTPSQLFIDTFFMNDVPILASLECNPEIYEHFKSLIRQNKLKQMNDNI